MNRFLLKWLKFCAYQYTHACPREGLHAHPGKRKSLRKLASWRETGPEERTKVDTLAHHRGAVGRAPVNKKKTWETMPLINPANPGPVRKLAFPRSPAPHSLLYRRSSAAHSSTAAP